MLRKLIKVALFEAGVVATVYAVKNYSKILDLFADCVSDKKVSEPVQTDAETSFASKINPAPSIVESEVKVPKKPAARKTSAKKEKTVTDTPKKVIRKSAAKPKVVAEKAE